MAPKKDSNRIFEMLAKRGLAEPVGPESDMDEISDEMELQASDEEAEAEARRRFFEEDAASEPPIPIPDVSMEQPPVDYWGAAPVNTGGVEAPDLDTYAEVSEIYRRCGMPLSGIDTVFLLEEYIAALPDSLPPEMRRSIVMKIVTASGFDFDKLLNDGIDRVTKLNEYASGFAGHTDDYVAANTAEIEALNRKIEQIQKQIAERKNLHKRQFLAIETEAQRLKEVLDFITK